MQEVGCISRRRLNNAGQYSMWQSFLYSELNVNMKWDIKSAYSKIEFRVLVVSEILYRTVLRYTTVHVYCSMYNRRTKQPWPPRTVSQALYFIKQEYNVWFAIVQYCAVLCRAVTISLTEWWIKFIALYRISLYETWILYGWSNERYFTLHCIPFVKVLYHQMFPDTILYL